MIESIRIKQFQKHKDTTLEFANGLNVICGESHNGKSAIIKAILWVLTNKPSGTAFRRIGHDGEDTSVKILFNDGSVERVRGDKRNCYIYDNEEFKAVRTDVPSEIQHFVNINECCLQSQFVPHYLLSDSPGEVARTLNSIVGLEDIDKANKHVGRIIAEANSQAKFIEGEIEKHIKSLERYAKLPDMEETLLFVSSQNSALEESQVFCDGLEVTTRSIDSLENLLIKKCERVLKHEEEVNRIFATFNKLRELELHIQDLESLIMDVKSVEYDMKEAKGLLSHVATVDSILEKIDALAEEEKYLEVLVKILRDMSSAIDGQTKINSKLAELHQEHDKIDVCPLCGGKNEVCTTW